MTYQTSECRDADCRAPIIWAITSTGKRMPVDADPVENGNVLLTATEEPGVVVATVADPTAPPLPGWGPLYMSHFATCPAADRWRTKRSRR